MNSVNIYARTGTVGESLCPRHDSRSCLRLQLEEVVEFTCGFAHREDVRWLSKKGPSFHHTADCVKTTQRAERAEALRILWLQVRLPPSSARLRQWSLRADLPFSKVD